MVADATKGVTGGSLCVGQPWRAGSEKGMGVCCRRRFDRARAQRYLATGAVETLINAMWPLWKRPTFVARQRSSSTASCYPNWVLSN